MLKPTKSIKPAGECQRCHKVPATTDYDGVPMCRLCWGVEEDSRIDELFAKDERHGRHYSGLPRSGPI